MAVQDRTQEFRSCVTSVSKINGSVHASSRQGLLNQDQQKQRKNPRSEFSKRASSIAQEISETTSMLQRLAMLAKRKTLFDDRPVEITELTYVIKQKVSKITNNISDLQTFVNSTKNSNSAWGNKKSENQLNEHSQNVVGSLKLKIQDVAVGFQEVLEVRDQNMKASKSRTEQFISSASSSVRDNSSSPLYGGGNGSTATNNNNTNNYDDNNNNNYGENPYNNAALEKDLNNPYGGGEDYLALPQQQSAVLLEEQQDQYLSQRNNAVEAIESTIQELGGIFTQLATMVAEQGETVQRIDANTEDISMNVSGAQRELLKYYARVSSNRWLMLKAFGVIIFFFLLWVLVS